jgi:3-hydroxy acid dehydrogenase / malonic semialdehyde reductase
MSGSLSNQTVLITGASSGIGLSCARRFAGSHSRLILVARREDRLRSVAEELRTEHGSNVHSETLDVSSPDEIRDFARSLPSEFSKVDILINNAGLALGLESVHEMRSEDIDRMIDVNIRGLLHITREILPGMIERNRGHIINIGSTAGHAVYPGGTVYCATKHAVKAITEGLKMDIHGTAVRVSSVDPGLVETEFSVVRFGGDSRRASSVYEGMTPLTPEDVADVVHFCATRPPHVNISDVVMMPVDQSSPTLVNRRP